MAASTKLGIKRDIAFVSFVQGLVTGRNQALYTLRLLPLGQGVIKSSAFLMYIPTQISTLRAIVCVNSTCSSFLSRMILPVAYQALTFLGLETIIPSVAYVVLTEPLADAC